MKEELTLADTINCMADSLATQRKLHGEEITRYLDALREACDYIQKGAGHRLECDFMKGVPRPPCTCGSANLIATINKLLPPEGK